MEPQSGARRRGKARLLLVFLACSVALHVAALMTFPEIGRRPPPTLHVLEVVLVKPEPPVVAALPEPPRPAAAEPAASEAKEKSAGAMPNRLPVQAKPGQRPEDPIASEEAPPPVLERQAAFEPAASLSSPPPAAQPAKPAAARGDPLPVARESTPVSAPISTPVSAPIFNAGYLHNPLPRYPLIARRNGEEGTVLLKVLVTRDGVPSTVDIESSSGSEHLDRAAREAVRNWRFVPAKQDSRPIEAWVLVPIVFQLEGGS